MSLKKAYVLSAMTVDRKKGYIHYDEQKKEYFVSPNIKGACVWVGKKHVKSFVKAYSNYNLKIEKLNYAK